MLNLFSLHGKYFQDDENRLTANVLVLLSENRSTFLPAFLRALGIRADREELGEASITFQVPFESAQGRRIPDAEITIGERVHVLVEAKIGHGRLRSEQIRSYAGHLAASRRRMKRLLCITQIADRENYESIVRGCSEALPSSCFRYLRWFEVVRLLQASVEIGDESSRKLDRSVCRGRDVGHGKRLATLFLRDLERTMYDRVVVDELPIGSTPEVTITTQAPWFMEAALKKRVWFPSSSTEFGLSPSTYVAYYQVDKPGNKLPKHITHLARNRVYWNRISLSDARQLPELRHLFRDPKVDREISSWGFGDHGTFHVVLTDGPIPLRRPIPLGKKRVARILTKRKATLLELVNAQSVDDLFG